MHVKTAEFVTSAVKPSQYPPPQFSEIAFAGRSNVGKSSLINRLVNRKRLVKTSATPGRTQLINFFIVNQTISLVDLPGYGYARVPKSVKKHWGPMVEAYLSQRESLKAVILLMDVRRTPRQEEFTLMEWLQHYCIPMIMVLTKADKLSKTKQIKQRQAAAKAIGIDAADLHLFSAKSGLGRDTIWDLIEQVLEPDAG